MKYRFVGLVFSLLLLLGFAVAPASAQERTIRGTVVDSTTGSPISNPSVQVEGSELGVIGERDGSFVLRGAPEGEVTLVFRRIGFRTKRVTVPSGQNTVEIRVRRDYLRLDELVVTGRATQTERQNLAINVASISSQDLATNTPAPSIEASIQGKAPGVIVSDNSGAPGGGMQMRIRGTSSIFAGSSPLYVVDGTIISNQATGSGLNAVTQSAGGTNASNQDDAVNRVADLNPEDIKSIEILKGATAAAIYGSKAANGVVVITTKKGSSGEPSIRLSQRFGVSDLSNTIGSRKFGSVQEAVNAGYSIAAQEPFASRIENGVAFDNEANLADRNDLNVETSASVSGGTEALNYFGSGLWKENEGIIPNTGFDKQSARLNLKPNLGDRWSLNVNANLIHSNARRGISNNDNSQTSYYMVLSLTPSFIDLRRDANGNFEPNPAPGVGGSNPLQTAELFENDEDVWRGLGSVNLDFQAVNSENHNIRLSGTAGFDAFNQENEIFSPPALFFEDDDGLPGTSVLGKIDHQNYNVSVNAIWDWTPAILSGGSSTFSTGFQFERRDNNVARITSQNLNAGFPNVDVGAQTAIFENKTQVEDFGVFVQEEILALDDRLSLQGSVRFDQSSANGDPDDVFVYPNAHASFRFPDLGDVVESVKLRAAWGQSGNQPEFGQKFTELAAANNIEGIPGVVIGTQAGASDIEPETTTEYEGGVDVTLFDGRAQLQATLYRQEIDDMILQRELAPSKGLTTEFFNGGKMENEGFEASLRATPLAGDVTWNTTTSFATNSSEVLSLPVPAFSPGPGFGIGGDPLIEEGKSLTQIISLVDGEQQTVGDTEPAYTMNFINDIEWKGLSLHSVVDWRHDRDVINLTELLYDFAQISPDWDPPGDEPRPISECGDDCSGLERVTGLLNGTQSQWVQDAGFIKLRELSLTWTLPDEFTNFVSSSLSSLELTLSGRNLLTATDYRGLTPEVSNFGNQAVGRNIDVAPFPPSRSFWVTVDANF